MKTYDGEKLILDRLTKSLASYPAGSVTPRTIVAHLKIDSEEAFAKVDTAISTQLINYAEKVHNNQSLLKRVKLSDEEVNDMTKSIVDSANNITMVRRAGIEPTL